MTFQFTHFDLFGGPMFNNALATITNGYTELTQASFLDPLSIFAFSILVSLISVVYIFIKTWDAEDSFKPIIDFDAPWHGNIITKGILVYLFATLLLTPIPVIQYSPIIAVDTTTTSSGTNANKTQLKTWLINDMKTTASPFSSASVSQMALGIDDNRRTRVEFVPMILWPIGAFEKMYYGFPDITTTEIETLIKRIGDVSTLGSTDLIGYDYFKWDPVASKNSDKTLFGCLTDNARDFLDQRTYPHDYDNQLQARYHFGETDIDANCLSAFALNDTSLAVSIFGINAVSGVLQDFFEPIDRFFGLLVNSTASDVVMAKLNSEKTKLRVTIAARDYRLSQKDLTGKSLAVIEFGKYVKTAIQQNNILIVEKLKVITEEMKTMRNSEFNFPKQNYKAALVGLISQAPPPKVWITKFGEYNEKTTKSMNDATVLSMAPKIFDASNTNDFTAHQILTLCLDASGIEPTNSSECEANLKTESLKYLKPIYPRKSEYYWVGAETYYAPSSSAFSTPGISPSSQDLLKNIIDSSHLAQNQINIDQIIDKIGNIPQSIPAIPTLPQLTTTPFSKFKDMRSTEEIDIGETLNHLYRLDRFLADHQLILSYLTHISKAIKGIPKETSTNDHQAVNTIFVQNHQTNTSSTNGITAFTAGFYEVPAIEYSPAGEKIEFYVNFEEFKNRLESNNNTELSLSSANKSSQKDYILFKDYVGFGTTDEVIWNIKPSSSMDDFTEAQNRINTILLNIQPHISLKLNQSEILNILPISLSALKGKNTQVFRHDLPSSSTEFNKIQSLPWIQSDKDRMTDYFQKLAPAISCPIDNCSKAFRISNLSDYMLYRYSESVSNNKQVLTEKLNFEGYVDAAATLKYYLAESINDKQTDMYARSLLDMMVMAKDQLNYPAGYSVTGTITANPLPFTDDFLDDLVDNQGIFQSFKAKYSKTTEADVVAVLKTKDYWEVIDNIMDFRATDMSQEATSLHVDATEQGQTTFANTTPQGTVDGQCNKDYSPIATSSSTPVKIDFDGLSSVPILGTLFKAIIQSVWIVFDWIMGVIREFQNTVTYSTTDAITTSSGQYNPTAIFGMYKSSVKGISCQKSSITSNETSSVSASGLFKPSTEVLMRPVNNIIDLLGDAQDVATDNKVITGTLATGATAYLGNAAYKKGWKGIKSSIKDFLWAIVTYAVLLTLALLYFFGIIFFQMLKFAIMSAVSVFIGMVRAIIILPLILSLKVLAFDPAQRKTYEHLSWMDSMGFWSNFWASSKQILAPLIIATAGFVLLAAFDYIIYPFALELTLMSFIDSLAGTSGSYFMTSMLILAMAFLYYKLIRVVFNYSLGIITSNVNQDPLLTGLKEWKEQSKKLSKLE